MITKIRRLLIHIGKMLPFAMCAIVCLNYAETALALLLSGFMCYDGTIIPNTQFSFLIGHYLEYNIQMLFVLVVLSYAISTCLFNKLACGFLGINLIEKSYFDFELEPTYIYIICIANIIVAWWLTWKGIIIITRKSKS